MPSVRKQSQKPTNPANKPVESPVSDSHEPTDASLSQEDEPEYDLVEQEDEPEYDLVEQDQDQEQSTFFQAIGTLYGKVSKNEEGQFYIALGRLEYRLFILRHRYRAWLKQFENAPDVPLYLKVYPKILIIPRAPMIISFQVVAWSSTPFPDQETEPGIFIFKGIWQFLPQIKTPVISVYRNANAVDPTEKFKATHLPVLMRRSEEDIRPFRFNPKIPKDQLPPRWFIQARFKFIPTRECFGWVEDLEPPSRTIPRYKKPIKPTASPTTPTENPNQKQYQNPPKKVFSASSDKPISDKPKPLVLKPTKPKNNIDNTNV